MTLNFKTICKFFKMWCERVTALCVYSSKMRVCSFTVAQYSRSSHMPNHIILQNHYSPIDGLKLRTEAQSESMGKDSYRYIDSLFIHWQAWTRVYAACSEASHGLLPFPITVSNSKFTCTVLVLVYKSKFWTLFIYFMKFSKNFLIITNIRLNLWLMKIVKMFHLFKI